MFDKNKIENLLKIKKTFSSSIDENYFIELLKKHNAVIAGSFVLSQYAPPPSFKPYDMDIYINEKHFDDFITTLLKMGIFASSKFLLIGLNTSSTYDQSFFKKNGIKFKISGFITLKETFRTDIMIVRNDRNIKDVVSNFDLSICEIWYNGKDIQATHEDHILKKEGMLRKEYHTAFFQGNKFIMKRIQKYTNRGFTIKLEKMDNYIISIQETYKELHKKNAEECLVKHVLWKLLLDYIAPITRPSNTTLNNPLFAETLDSKIKKCSKLDRYERMECYSKQLYLYCNSFQKYDIIELYLNSRVFLGCKSGDIYKYIFQLQNGMKYNKNGLESLLKRNIGDKSIITRKIKNINNILDFINTLSKKDNFPDVDNVQLLLKNISYKYRITKNQNYVMEPITVSEDISEINGYNIITLDNSKVGEYLNDNDTNIVLINYDDDKIIGDVCLMDRESLESYILNLKDQWFYKCNEMNRISSVVKSTPYIKLPTNTHNIYVYWYELFDMYFRNKKGQNVFIYKETDELINYSISHHNAFNENPDWVGANHCQDRSNLKISKIYYMSNSMKKSRNSSMNKSRNSSTKKSIINSEEKSLLQHLNEKTVNKRNSKVKSLSLKSSPRSSKSSNSPIISL